VATLHHARLTPDNDHDVRVAVDEDQDQIEEIDNEIHHRVRDLGAMARPEPPTRTLVDLSISNE